MLTFKKFSGIDNVQPQYRLGSSDLTVATNVDIGLSGEICRRSGFTEVSPSCHKNLHQSEGYMLATIDGGDLTAIFSDGSRVLVYPSLGPSRVWYCNLPGGLTAFSNSLIHGITDGGLAEDWSVPRPDYGADFIDVGGALFPGLYQCHITHTRLVDGIEGPPLSMAPMQSKLGGIFLSGLPVRDGCKTNVYLSGNDGEGAYLAGITSNSLFSFVGANNLLTLPCRTMGMDAAPVGAVMAFWRGRVLVADGPVLWASCPANPRLFDLVRDFKQFTAPITLIQPVDDGIYIGTKKELAFLEGGEFDKLMFRAVLSGPVVLGSGVAVPGDKVALGKSVGIGSAMMCIANKGIVAGFNSGQVVRVTEGRYHTDATEVSAAFRTIDGIPQYMAVPQ